MSRGNFNTCFKFTIGEEGEYSTNPDDPGNWSSGEVGVGSLIGSCWGISAPTLISWVGSHNAHLVTPDYMKSLPIQSAQAIYLARYWNVIRGDELTAGVDLAVWDFAVNAGDRESAIQLQQCVGTTADGVIGPITLEAVKSFWPVYLIGLLVEAHDRFYRSLHEPEWLDGWLKRQERVKATAISMAKGT